MATERSSASTSSAEQSVTRKFVPLNEEECQDLMDAVCQQTGIRRFLLFMHCGISTVSPLSLLNASMLPIYKIQIKFCKDTFSNQLFIGDELICSEPDTDFNLKKIEIRNMLVEKAVQILQKDCFQITRKRDNVDIRKSDLIKINLSVLHGFNPMNNIFLMEQPAGCSRYNGKTPKDILRQYMNEFDASKNTVLTFDPTFNEYERKFLAKYARSLNFRPKEEKNGTEIKFVMQKKNINLWEIVKLLIMAGGDNGNYTLNIPENFRHFVNYY